MMNKRLLYLGAAALLSLTVSAAAAETSARSLTFAQINSAPYPSHLTPAPAGDAAAWVFDTAGARNVWVAEPGATGAYAARALTHYTGDDGMEIWSLAWSGAQTLVYERGGDRDGATPTNVMSAVAGVKGGELFAVALAGGNPRRLADGYAPAPSPRGDVVAFIRNGQAFAVPVAGGDAAQLWKDRGQVGGLTWSPDGSKLAFTTTRLDHTLIGVYDVAAKTLSWMSPGIDQDRNPVWSPDGKHLAFLRLPSTQHQAFTANREGPPWEIWVADAASGKGQRVWRANAGPGSVFHAMTNSSSSLFWAANDTLIFPWEGTGWQRLYAVPARGGQATLLTPGDGELFASDMSADRTRLIFSSNAGDIDQRHIWEIDVKGGRLRELTHTLGVQDYPIYTHGGRRLALRGDARVPLRPVEIGANQSMKDIAASAIPSDFPTKDLVEPRTVTFKAADGLTVHGQLFVPQGRTTKGPALLFFHGGPVRQLFAAWDSMAAYAHLYEVNQYLANHGYVVLSVNYRGGLGYGLDYREAPGFGAGGASEANDIIGAAKFMVAQDTIDPKRIGLWGGSYGGRMVSLAAVRAPEYFAAVVDYAGVHDWTAFGKIPIGAPGYQLAYQSSAIADADKWRAPVMFMHGDADINVPFSQTTEMADALRRRNIPVEYTMIPEEVHFLLRSNSWGTLATTVQDFMGRTMK